MNLVMCRPIVHINFINERISSFDAIVQVRLKIQYRYIFIDVTSSIRYEVPPNLRHVCINGQITTF